MAQQYQNDDDDRKKKRRIIPIIIIIILVVIIGCLVVFFVVNNNSGSGVEGEYIGDNGQGMAFETNQETGTKVIKSVEMPGWNNLRFVAGSTEQEVDFYNPEGNAGNFHLVFEVKLADGESLYKSGLVKAGDHVRNITLSRALDAGTYDAVVHIQPYTADDKLTAKNNADVNVKLIVA